MVVTNSMICSPKSFDCVGNLDINFLNSMLLNLKSNASKFQFAQERIQIYEQDHGSECGHEAEVLLGRNCANSWCFHEKSPSPPFTARLAAGTILATLLSPTLSEHSVHIHTSSTQGALCLWRRVLIVCNMRNAQCTT